MSAELTTVNLRGKRPAVFYARRAYRQMSPVDRGEIRVLLRDLDTAKKMAGMSPEQRTGYLLLDLGKVMFTLFCSREYLINSRYGMISLAGFAVSFMQGYLGHRNVRGFEPEEWRELIGPYAILLDNIVKGKRISIDLPKWARNHPAPGIRFVYDFMTQAG